MQVDWLLLQGSELGRGSFGVVISGVWQCQSVAVKILDIASGRPPTDKDVKEFISEGRLQQRL